MRKAQILLVMNDDEYPTSHHRWLWKPWPAATVRRFFQKCTPRNTRDYQPRIREITEDGDRAEANSPSLRRENRVRGCGGGEKEIAAGLLPQEDGKSITENEYFVDDSVAYE